MSVFNFIQLKKYNRSKIAGTGLLAFRDLSDIINIFDINMGKVLDVGCGCGRSTEYLAMMSDQIHGMDIDQDAVKLSAKNVPQAKFFLGSSKDKHYGDAPYTSIFSILTLFHFESEVILMDEMKRSYDSLSHGGHLVIVNGTKLLYERDYFTVAGIGDPVICDGDKTKVYLKNIDCIIEDYFWSEEFVKKCAEKNGFIYIGIRYPLGMLSDKQPYKDEFLFPPYYVLILKKV